MKQGKVLYAVFGLSDGWVLHTSKKEAMADFNDLDIYEEPRIVKLKMTEDITPAEEPLEKL